MVPANGTAVFDRLSLLAQPGSSQTVTFRLVSEEAGAEVPGGIQVCAQQHTQQPHTFTHSLARKVTDRHHSLLCLCTSLYLLSCVSLLRLCTAQNLPVPLPRLCPPPHSAHRLQVVQVSLPNCSWGQATTPVGCHVCTSPLFTFASPTSRCSICPQQAALCSGTSLLPGEGYWVSGPRSTRLHRCPRRSACSRCVWVSYVCRT